MHARLLTDKDVLVLADFTNTTSDPIFDVTLRQALAFQLEQSPFLTILSDDQARQDLALMRRSDKDRITNDVAHDICVREGDKAMISGSIASMGKAYAISLQATNCGDGDIIAREMTTADDKEHVLTALGAAAKSIRSKLGESLGSIRKFDAAPEVTTTSLEALRAFSLGEEEMDRGSRLAAIPFFERALALDQNFASAYRLLGIVYRPSEPRRAAEYFKKAFELRDRLPERERLELAGDFYFDVIHEWPKALDARQVFAQTFPRDPEAHNLLGTMYSLIGEIEKATEEYKEAIRLNPRFAIAYANVMHTLIDGDRLEDAKSLAPQALAQKVDVYAIHSGLLRIAFMQNDPAVAGKEMQWFAGKPEEYMGLREQAVNADVLGKRHEAEELFGRASKLAGSRSLTAAATSLLVQNAEAQTLAGECSTASSQMTDPMILAFCGESGQIQKIMDRFPQSKSNDTLWNAIRLPLFQAARYLRLEKPAEAIEARQPSIPYEKTRPQAIYLRGLANLDARKGTEAAAEFKKIVAHRGAYWGQLYSLSYVGLARAAALAGDTQTAKKAYQDFFALWKDADSSMPVLIAARKEYAALN